MRKSAHLFRAVMAGLASTSLVLAMPARADSQPRPDTSASERLRQLDIMLMVTGLRCRNTADDFQADFQAFEARHLTDLNAAAREISKANDGRVSENGGDLALDRLSVQMANQYGQGHPWLACRDLKGLVHDLAQRDGRDVLLQAAGEVLDGDGSRPAHALPDAPAPGAPIPIVPEPMRIEAIAVAAPIYVAETLPPAKLDCASPNANPNSNIAYVVCDSVSLKSIDEQIGSIYSTLYNRASLDQRGQFAEDQRNWIEIRDACASEICVRGAYQQRLRAVTTQAWAQYNSQHAADSGNARAS